MSNGADIQSIDVIVPVFNAERYILSSLQSIAKQTFCGLNVYVVDDCSTDNSAEIIQNFCLRDARFRYIRTPNNFGGPAGPRNLGIAQGTSEWIAFCDSDDIWMEHKLDVQVAVLNQFDYQLLCGGIVDFADGKGFHQVEAPHLLPATRPISHNKLMMKNWVAMSTVLVKREAVARVGAFNEARTHIAVEDFDMWLRLTGLGYRIGRISYPLVHYRKAPTSISADKKMMVQKALNIIGNDYIRSGRARAFRFLRPLHWLLYIGTSAWMRTVRKAL